MEVFKSCVLCTVQCEPTGMMFVKWLCSGVYFYIASFLSISTQPHAGCCSPCRWSLVCSAGVTHPGSVHQYRPCHCLPHLHSAATETTVTSPCYPSAKTKQKKTNKQEVTWSEVEQTDWITFLSAQCCVLYWDKIKWFVDVSLLVKVSVFFFPVGSYIVFLRPMMVSTQWPVFEINHTKPDFLLANSPSLSVT